MSYSTIQQPLDSKVRITPYSQRLLQYGVEDSRIYLSKVTNSLLLNYSLGYSSDDVPESDSYNKDTLTYETRTNCILDGLRTSYDLDGNVLTVVISEGNCLVDGTMLTFPNPTTLGIDLSNYGTISNCGKVIVSINFQWVDSPYENPPTLRLGYQDFSNPDTVQPNGWWVSLDRLIITYFTFDKDTSGNVIPETIVNFCDDPFTNRNKTFLGIKNYPYEIAPLPKLFYNFLKYYQFNYPTKINAYIPASSSVWTSVTDSELPWDDIDNKVYYYHDINISTIANKNVTVQCYIDDLQIQPTAIQLISSEYVRIWMPDRFVNGQAVTVNIIDVYNTWQKIAINSNDSLDCWVINNDIVSCTANSVGLVGFISNSKTSNYVTEVTVKSTSADDDAIGIIVAYTVIGDTKHALFLFRDHGGYSMRWGLMYVYCQDNMSPVSKYIAASQFSTAISNLDPYTYAPNSGHGWDTIPNGTRIFSQRSGNLLSFKCSNYDSEEYVDGSLVNIDLDNYSELSVFSGSCQYGYGAISQPNSEFSNAIIRYPAIKPIKVIAIG